MSEVTELLLVMDYGNGGSSTLSSMCMLWVMEQVPPEMLKRHEIRTLMHPAPRTEAIEILGGSSGSGR